MDDVRRGNGSPDPEQAAGRLLRVALTGGIATGKSHCLRTFAALGAPVIDADVLAREAVRVGSPGFTAVTQRFGPDVVGADGDLDRAALGRIVFHDAAARRDLEQIIHPWVFGRIMAWFDETEKEARIRAAIADIPLLFETGHQSSFDKVVVAACSADEALRRLVARDALSLEDAKMRLNSQIPIERKMALADYVIDTSGSRADTEEQVADVLARLEQRPPADGDRDT